MTAQQSTVPSLPEANTASVSVSNDSAVAVVGGNTCLMPISWVGSGPTPASSGANTGITTVGTVWTDGLYLYVVTGSGLTKRTPLSTF